MKKTFWQNINDIGIQKKLWLLNVMGVFVPLIVLFSIFIGQIYIEYEQHEKTLIDEAIDRVVKNVDIVFDSASNITLSYLSDEYMNNIITEQTFDSTYDVFVSFNYIEDRLEADIYTYDFIGNISIFHKNELLNVAGHSTYYDENEMGEWYNDLYSIRDNQVIRIVLEDNVSRIFFLRKLNAIYHESKNFVEIEISNKYLLNELADEYLVNYDSTIYLIDDYQRIVATNQEDYNYNPNETIDSKYKAAADQGQTYLRKPISSNRSLEGWSVVVVYDETFLTENIRNRSLPIALIAISILIISSFLVQKFASSISYRLRILDQAMTRSEDDELTMVTEDLGRDEIGLTALRYNEMVQNTKRLIEQVENGRKRANELLVEKTEAYMELEALSEEIRVQGTKIHDLIYIDELTGLMNRYAINQEIDRTLKVCNHLEKVAIMFLDIDNFKNINDTFGHDIGDKVIRATGKILSDLQEDWIKIGRFGGDEFLIMIYSPNAQKELHTLTDKIEKALVNPVKLKRNKFYLSLSIGIAMYPDNGISKEDIIKKADQALYQAKAKGKNQYVIFDESMNYLLNRKIKLQNGIKEATKKKLFHLNYQPYVNTITYSIEGFEALIRWESPVFGRVSPYELITNAEEMGIIIEIGEWIIDEACQFIKRINDGRTESLTISINISAVQLMHSGFVDKLNEIVESVGVDKKDIHLEITETVMIASISTGVSQINQLRDYGYGVSLDDFGTGFSSLSYFKELPVSVLKIDKAFIDDLVEDSYNQELVQTIVKISHNRGIEVVAEGVETSDQLDYLSAIGVDIIQGYYFYKPMGEEDVLAALNKSSERKLVNEK